MMTELSTGDTRATRKEWLGLAVIALPCMLYSMDLTVLNLAVPKLTAALNPSSQQLLWIVDIYGFLLAGFLITMGILGDRIGRRKLLMTGAGAFGFASLVAAFATTPEMLIGARALLGIAGATLAPSTLSLIRNMFLDDRERTSAIAIWITSFSLGGAVGPIIGGILLEYYWWGSVFLIALPVMISLLVLAPFLLPEYRNPSAGHVDLRSVLLSLMTTLSIVFAIKTASASGLTLPVAAAGILGLTTGVLFIRRQRTLKDPFLDLTLFTIPSLSTSLWVYMFSTFILFGMFFLIAQYLQLVLGLSPMTAGIWTLPSFAGFILGSMAVPRLTARVAPRHLIVGGLLTAATGFALLTALTAGGPAIVIASLAMFSLGIAPVFTLSTDMIVGKAPAESAGMAASLAETASEFGGALGIAILGTIGASIYLNEVRQTGLSPSPTGTFAGDVAAATAGASLQTAQDAFTIALIFVAGVCTAITLVLTLLFLRAHRGARR